MGDIRVYKLNDYEWWASKLSIEDTAEFYEREIGEKIDIEDVEECDTDKGGLWWELETDSEEYNEAELKLEGYDSITHTEQLQPGDLMKDHYGEIRKWITFREAINRSGEYKEPFCIASTEW